MNMSISGCIQKNGEILYFRGFLDRKYVLTVDWQTEPSGFYRKKMLKLDVLIELPW